MDLSLVKPEFVEVYIKKEDEFESLNEREIIDHCGAEYNLYNVENIEGFTSTQIKEEVENKTHGINIPAKVIVGKEFSSEEFYEIRNEHSVSNARTATTDISYYNLNQYNPARDCSSDLNLETDTQVDMHKESLINTFEFYDCELTSVQKNVLVKHCNTEPTSTQKNIPNVPNSVQINDIRYECYNCEFEATTEYDLKTHMRTHIGSDLFSCSDCDYKTIYKHNFTKHKVKHAGVKAFSCSDCEYKTTTNANLINHKRLHTGEKPFQCSECTFKTAYRGSLTDHKRIHAGDKRFHCTECTFKTVHRGSLIDHQRVHAGEKPFHCTVCEFKTAYKKQLRKHERRHANDDNIHDENKPNKYYCFLCGFKTAHKVNWIKHKLVHSNGQNQTDSN